MEKKVIIAGGSGLIGRALANDLSSSGFQVFILSRSTKSTDQSITYLKWDGSSIGPWAEHFENASAVVNLTGKSIDCRPTKQNLKECLESRRLSIGVLGEACSRCPNPPKTWIQASAIGFYGDAGDTICNEDTSPNPTQLSDLCQKWEQEFHGLTLKETRKIVLRIGVVFAAEGGALPKLVSLTRSFLGGSAGSGKQFVSWIDLRDAVRLIKFAIENENVNGVYNATSPNPVTNQQFMATLRKITGRPWCPPAPAFAVKLGAMIISTNPALALESQRCSSQKIVDAGFQFEHEDLENSIRSII